jgi:hypothetical protein
MQTESAPQEERRLHVPRAFLERMIQDLHEYVQGCVAELVFSLDEVVISDWEHCKTKKAIALAAMFGQMIHHGVSRNVKHISVITCLSAAGESLLHQIVTSQNFVTVQQHFNKTRCSFRHGFRLDIQPEALHQCWNLPRLYQNHPLIRY